MLDYQQQFIQFAIESKVLQFGEFTLKSGRTSPYFFNTGLFNTGLQMVKLSEFFAASIQHSNIKFDVLFGPAYKGITLSCATAMALAKRNHQDIPFAYNRKEAKSHGEGGSLVGSPLHGDIAIIDDVITAGTAIRESFSIIEQHEANAKAVFIALDRQERGQIGDELSDKSAIQQVEIEFALPVVAIANLSHLIEYLKTDKQYARFADPLQYYRDQYGIDAQ